MENTISKPSEKRPGRAKLIWAFLRGARAMFLLCMLCAALSALSDMITPQIIRAAVMDSREMKDGLP